MSLRFRLFALFGGLLVLFAGAEAWLARSLSRDLSAGVSQLAFSVGRAFVSGDEETVVDAPPSPNECRIKFRHVVLDEAPKMIVWKTADGREVRKVSGRTEQIEIDCRGADCDEKMIARTASAIGAPPRPVVVRAGMLPAMPALAAELAKGLPDAAEFELSVDQPGNAKFLVLSGPNLQRKIPIARGSLDAALEAFRNRLLLGSALILGCGLLAAALLAHRVTAPLRELSAAARAVGSGELGTQAKTRAGGEVGEAVLAFNRMSTRLSELEAAAREMRAQEQLGEIGEVARGLAHTLRNPLHSLGLAVDELGARAEKSDAPAGSLVDSARSQIRRIDASIRSFLALASGGSCAATEAVDLRPLVEDVALEATQDARGRVSIGVLGESVSLPVVPPEIRAVVQALVVNAVDASPDGGAVEVSVAKSPTGAEIVVADRGPGLPPEVRERLFSPHVTTKPSGSGMGLFLAHRIATARYGGELRLDPREGGGTRAVLTLAPRRGGPVG